MAAKSTKIQEITYSELKFSEGGRPAPHPSCVASLQQEDPHQGEHVKNIIKYKNAHVFTPTPV